MHMRSPFLREMTLKEQPAKRDVYPFTIPALSKTDLHLSFPAPVTFFVGENGSGKSTMMEAIAIGCGFNPAGGGRNHAYDYRPTESSLAHYIRLIWNFKMTQGFFLRAESFFGFATYLEDWEKETGMDFHEPFGGKSLHQQSHGESFMALFQNHFQRGIYLLDEPEAALSPQRQLVFLARLHTLVTSGDAQFIIATHSPILLSYPGATIYQFDENGIRQVIYEETEHFTVTKDFLNAYQGFYKHLFQDNND